jgi:hypothetical protein
MVLLISRVGRKLVLKQRTEEGRGRVPRHRPAGRDDWLLSYGEISPFTPGAASPAQTIIITTLWRTETPVHALSSGNCDVSRRRRPRRRRGRPSSRRSIRVTEAEIDRNLVETAMEISPTSCSRPMPSCAARPAFPDLILHVDGGRITSCQAGRRALAVPTGGLVGQLRASSAREQAVFDRARSPASPALS